MTQEEKQLLIKDLCGRLPYNIKCYYNSLEIDDDIQDGISTIKGFNDGGTLVELESGDVIGIEDTMPYLRPISNMTEKEIIEWHETTFGQRWITFDNVERCVDWLNAHYFDYRIVPSTGKTLIESGIALEAPKNMYKTE